MNMLYVNIHEYISKEKTDKDIYQTFICKSILFVVWVGNYTWEKISEIGSGHICSCPFWSKHLSMSSLAYISLTVSPSLCLLMKPSSQAYVQGKEPALK